MTKRIKGYCYSGANAAKQATHAICSEDGAIQLEADLAPSTPIAELEISNPVGAIARTITFPNGAMFETTDHDKLNRWLATHSPGGSWVHRLESSWRFVFLALFVTSLVVFVGAPAITAGSLGLLMLLAPTMLSVWIGELGAFVANPFGDR